MEMIGAKVQELIALLQDKRTLRLDKIYIGSGGNEEGDYRRMTLAWIQGRVRDMVLS
jgi:hypothetical protein